MMKAKFIIISMLAAILLMACSKDEVTETATNSDPNSYYPLTLNNLWTYKTPGMSVEEKINASITGTKVINGKTYFVIISSEKDTTYVRKDENGNIAIPDSTLETIIIPANPKLKDEWLSADSSKIMIITSTTATVNANVDLLQVSTYDNEYINDSLRIINTTERIRNYYKKGLGLIRSTNYSTGYERTLNAHDLK